MKKGTLTPNNWNARLRGVFGCIHINIDRYWWEGDHQPGYWGTVPYFQTNKLPYYDWVGRAMKYFSWRMPQKKTARSCTVLVSNSRGVPSQVPTLTSAMSWPVPILEVPIPTKSYQNWLLFKPKEPKSLRHWEELPISVWRALSCHCVLHHLAISFRAPTKYWAATAQELPRRPAHGGPKRIPKHWAADSWCAQLVDRANRSGWACRTSGCEPWVILAKFALKRDGKRMLRGPSPSPKPSFMGSDHEYWMRSTKHASVPKWRALVSLVVQAFLSGTIILEWVNNCQKRSALNSHNVLFS